MSDTPDEQEKEPTRPPEWLMNGISVVLALMMLYLIWMIWHYDLRLWA